MYLVHWPVKLKAWVSDPLPRDDEFEPLDFKSTWLGMEKCLDMGLCRGIGVSNFSCKKLQTLMDFASVPPALNQVSLPATCCFQNHKIESLVSLQLSIVLISHSSRAAGGNAPNVEAKEAERFLQRSQYPCKRVFSSRRAGKFLGFDSCCGQSHHEIHR